MNLLGSFSRFFERRYFVEHMWMAASGANLNKVNTIHTGNDNVFKYSEETSKIYIIINKQLQIKLVIVSW